MATDIDSLQIQLTASTKSANDKINTLVKNIDKLTGALQRISTGNLNGLSNDILKLGDAIRDMNSADPGKITKLASGVEKLSKSVSNANHTDTSNFSTLSKSLKKIASATQGFGNINATGISKLFSSITSFSNINTDDLKDVAKALPSVMKAFKKIDKVPDDVSKIAEFANGISKLGNKSATKAIENMPKLASAVNKMMKKLSKAPKVSQNLINMTNALAKLARTGASSGRAAESLSKSFNSINKSSGKANINVKKIGVSFSELAKKILAFVSIAKLIDLGKQSIEIASDLTEVQNVVDTTFGNYKQKMEDLAAVSIPELGMSELTAKQLGSRFQAIGTALGFSQGKMADMSIELTRLTGDMASFYNASQEDVGKALQSIFTGETEPMRKYGVDLTNATIQQWALNNGIEANMSSMSQAEKATLRYQYVMERTAAAQGDFARTQDTWANQTRILVENLKSLGGTVGTALINVFKPLVSWLNGVMTKVISVVKNIVDALGAIFGWTLEITPTGSTYDDAASGMEDISDAADDAGSSMGNAADKANELKKAVMGFDEIDKLPDESSSSGGGSGSGSGSGNSSSGDAASGSGTSMEVVKTEGVLEKYKSEIKTLEQLGKYIGESLTKAMESIPWKGIYEKAGNFGTGLASFLNGLISPELFGTLGATIANSINTALVFLDSFGDTFNWENFGDSLASGINSFFKNSDFKFAASTFKKLAKGVYKGIKKALKKIDWTQIGSQIKGFLSEIDLGEGFNELFSFAESAIGSFYTNALKPIGDWTLGTGLPKLLKVTRRFLKKIDWETLNSSLERFWSAVSPFATAVGEGLISFYEDLLAVGKKFINKVVPNALDKISTALEGMDAEQIEKIGYALGVVATSIAGIKITKSVLSNLEALFSLFGLKSLLNGGSSGNGSGNSGNKTGGVLSKLGSGLKWLGGVAVAGGKRIGGATATGAKWLKGKIPEVAAKTLGSSIFSQGMSAIGNFISSGAAAFFPMLFDSEIMTYQANQWKQIFSGNAQSYTVDKWKERQQNGEDGFLKSFYKKIGLYDKFEEWAIFGKKKIEADVEVNTEPATKKIDSLQTYTSKKELKIDNFTIPEKKYTKEYHKLSEYFTQNPLRPGIVIPNKVYKSERKEMDKYFSKNPIKTGVIIKDTEKTTQEKLNKLNPLLKTNVQLETTKERMHGMLGLLTTGFTYKIPAKIGTTAQALQGQITNNLSGYTAEFNAKANITKKDDSQLKKTLNGFTANIEEKTTKGLNKLISGFTGNIGEKTTNGLDKTISGITGVIKTLDKVPGLSLALTAVISFISNGLKLMFKKNGGVFSGGSWHSISTYAGGGLPSQGQMFVAREAGPELVGTLGGHTAVMNNNQIVASVSDGVYHAVAAAMSQFTGQMNGGTPNITVYVGGRQVTDVVVEEVNQRTKATGMCPIMV